MEKAKQFNDEEWMDFARRITTVSDLAAAYHPTIALRSARRILLDSAYSIPGMSDELCRFGFRPSQRNIYPAQVLVFFRWLGPPAEK